MINGKRGSHVGMMLSFLVFITFLAFLYTILEPTLQVDDTKKSLLEHLEKEVIDNCSSNLITMTIGNKTTFANPSNCVRLNNIEGNISETGAMVNSLIIKDELNNKNTYNVDGTNLDISNPQNLGFFKIYYGNGLSNSLGSLGVCPSEFDMGIDYKLGITRNESMIFEQKIIDLINAINTDYNNVKNQFQLSPNSEFGIEFLNSTGYLYKANDKNVSASVFSDEVPIKYVDNEANILSGFINIKVW